jgi:putative PIN family toxin of toxin-antitoxin system
VRAVVDTNILVSGLREPRGNPARVLGLVRSGVIVPLYDSRILAEYEEVLRRPRLRLSPIEVDELLLRVRADGESITAGPTVFQLPDPKDQPFLEVAIAGAAEAIITGNLRDFPLSCGVLIATPAMVVAALE